MNKTIIILLTLILSSCNVKPDKIDLSWKITPEEIIKYRATISEIEPITDFKLDGFEALKNPNLRNKVINKLKTYQGPTETLDVKLEGNKNGFAAKFVAIKPQYDSAPTSDDEKFKREILDNRAGTVEILAELNLKGDLYSFYLKQKQRNILALFFKLPDMKLEVGSKWKLPIALIEIGQGFVAEEAIREQEAELTGLTSNSEGDVIANISYVITEKVKGHFEYSYSDEIVPIAMNYTYLANGEFNVNKGRWARFTAISYLSGSGLSQNDNMMAFILRPAN